MLPGKHPRNVPISSMDSYILINQTLGALGSRQPLPAPSAQDWSRRGFSSRLPSTAALPPPVGAMERLLRVLAAQPTGSKRPLMCRWEACFGGVLERMGRVY
eukprot:4751499-Prymnesium_polylepis.1